MMGYIYVGFILYLIYYILRKIIGFAFKIAFNMKYFYVKLTIGTYLATKALALLNIRL